MYAKTSIQYRLGALTGLWLLHTTVQGKTDTCYFFRMGELYYQAKLGEVNLGYYLCQLEKLPEDVEALEPPVPAGTPVAAVSVEEYSAGDEGEGCVMLSLKLGEAGYLRFKLDGDMIGTSMAYSKDGPGADLLIGREIELCGYDTPAIPLPASAPRIRRILMATGVILFFGTLGLNIAMHGLLEEYYLFHILLVVGFVLTLTAPRMPWRFRCPYCKKAVMRPAGGVDLYVCPHCGNFCRPSKG